MPNNSGTVIIGGHGSYNKNYIFDVRGYNYNIVFPCSMNMQISNTAHNQLIAGFYNMGNQPYLNILETLPSTYIANRNGPPFAGGYDMSLKHTSLLFQHNISSADNVVNAISLWQIQNSGYIVANCINTQNWGGTTIKVQYNQAKIAQEILNNPPQNQGDVSFLENDDYIFITPAPPQGVVIDPMTMGFLFEEVLPNIKFPVAYNPMNNTALSLNPFIDNNIPLQDKINAYAANFQHGEIYNEVCIAGDSNIVWDACRDEV